MPKKGKKGSKAKKALMAFNEKVLKLEKSRIIDYDNRLRHILKGDGTVIVLNNESSTNTPTKGEFITPFPENHDLRRKTKDMIIQKKEDLKFEQDSLWKTELKDTLPVTMDEEGNEPNAMAENNELNEEGEPIEKIIIPEINWTGEDIHPNFVSFCGDR